MPGGRGSGPRRRLRGSRAQPTHRARRRSQHDARGAGSASRKASIVAALATRTGPSAGERGTARWSAGAVALAVAVPPLFLHATYQPTLSLPLGGTDVDLTLADLAIACVLVVAAHEAWRARDRASPAVPRWLLATAGLFAALDDRVARDAVAARRGLPAARPRRQPRQVLVVRAARPRRAAPRPSRWTTPFRSRGPSSPGASPRRRGVRCSSPGSSTSSRDAGPASGSRASSASTTSPRSRGQRSRVGVDRTRVRRRAPRGPSLGMDRARGRRGRASCSPAR